MYDHPDIADQFGANKGRDLVIISDLYEEHGLNYRIFANELPHLSPYAIERLAAMVKKQKKEEEKRKKEAEKQNNKK